MMGQEEAVGAPVLSSGAQAGAGCMPAAPEMWPDQVAQAVGVECPSDFEDSAKGRIRNISLKNKTNKKSLLRLASRPGP